MRGIVQGVGFRPFIYALARQHGLAGLVRNDAEGVHIEAEGPAEELDLFLHEIREKAPPLAVVEAVSWKPLVVLKERAFRIEKSREGVAAARAGERQNPGGREGGRAGGRGFPIFRTPDFPISRTKSLRRPLAV